MGSLTPCPECGAPAEVITVDAMLCTVVEAINSGGATLVHEGTELIPLVEVQCVAGHHFFGPEELIFRDGQVGTGDKAEPSAA
jgi:hypothetical protein